MNEFIWKEITHIICNIHTHKHIYTGHANRLYQSLNQMCNYLTDIWYSLRITAHLRLSMVQQPITSITINPKERNQASSRIPTLGPSSPSRTNTLPVLPLVGCPKKPRTSSHVAHFPKNNTLNPFSIKHVTIDLQIITPREWRELCQGISVKRHDNQLPTLYLPALTA